MRPYANLLFRGADRAELAISSTAGMLVARAAALRDLAWRDPGPVATEPAQPRSSTIASASSQSMRLTTS